MPSFHRDDEWLAGLMESQICVYDDGGILDLIQAPEWRFPKQPSAISSAGSTIHDYRATTHRSTIQKNDLFVLPEDG